MNFQQSNPSYPPFNTTNFLPQPSPTLTQFPPGYLQQPQVNNYTTATGPPTFYFKERKGRLNWGKLDAVDLNELRSGANMPALESCLGNITYAALSPEDCERFEDPNLLKMFRVSQYALEYLLNYQNHLYGQTQSLDTAYKQAEQSMKPLEAKARENLAEIQRLKQELRTKKKICNAYEHALNNPIFRCSLCKKCFKTQGFLDEHIKRRHVNAFGGTSQDKSSTLPSKIILRETATSPMIPKSDNMSKTMTSQFDIGDKENLMNQVNQMSQMKGQSMKEEKGVLTEGLYPQNNMVYAAATSTQTQVQDNQNFEKMQNLLKKFKDEDDQKISSLNQSINDKISQIMNVNNETAKKVNDLEHKVEAYQMSISRFSRSQIMDLTHEDHHDDIHEQRLEVPASQRTNEEIYRKSPMKAPETRYREQADYTGSGDVLEPREEHEEEEEEVIEKDKEGDLKIVELEEAEEDKPVRDHEKEEEEVQDIAVEEEEHEQPEYKEIDVEKKQVEENQEHFTQDKRDRIAAYNRLYHIDEQEEEPAAVEPLREAEREQVEEKEDITEEGIIRQEFNAGDMEDDYSESQSRSSRREQKNEKIKIEDQEEVNDENKSIPLRKKYPMASSSYRERPLEHHSIEEVEEHHEHEHEQEQQEELPYEDEDERERTMRIIESSMGIRGDEDKQLERDRKEYLKAKETMDKKYLAEMLQPTEMNKAEEAIKGDLKNSFKNMFGSEYDHLAGKDMNDLESILASLQTLNLKQKQRFDKMKTDYSRIHRKDVFADEDHHVVRKVENNEELLPANVHDQDEEKSIQEASFRLQKAKASLAELEQVLKENQ